MEENQVKNCKKKKLIIDISHTALFQAVVQTFLNHALYSICK